MQPGSPLRIAFSSVPAALAPSGSRVHLNLMCRHISTCSLEHQACESAARQYHMPHAHRAEARRRLALLILEHARVRCIPSADEGLGDSPRDGTDTGGRTSAISIPGLASLAAQIGHVDIESGCI